MPSLFELDATDQQILLADISGSMKTPDCPGGATRWSYLVETLEAFLVAAIKWDPDGPSLYTFNNAVGVNRDVKSIEELKAIVARVKPGGGTSTHLAIAEAYREHKEKKAANPNPADHQMFCMIFTDGEPSGPDGARDLKKVIVDITNDVTHEEEFRISILTIGQQSPELQAFLRDLDDNLVANDGAKYDIVAINKLEDVDFEQAIANAING